MTFFARQLLTCFVPVVEGPHIWIRFKSPRRLSTALPSTSIRYASSSESNSSSWDLLRGIKPQLSSAFESEGSDEFLRSVARVIRASDCVCAPTNHAPSISSSSAAVAACCADIWADGCLVARELQGRAARDLRAGASRVPPDVCAHVTYKAAGDRQRI